MAVAMVMVSARAQSSGAVNSTVPAAPTASTSPGIDTRPLPTAGKRSSSVLRRGSDRPPTTMATTMTRKATDRDTDTAVNFPSSSPSGADQRAEHPLVLDVAGQRRLHDADAERTGEGPPERAERAQERGRQPAQHREGERGDVEEQDRRHQHPGDGGEGAARGPVDHGDAVRRVPERGGRDRVLGGGVGGMAEPRPPVDRGEDGRHHDGDDDEPQPVLADGAAGPEEVARGVRQGRAHRRPLVTPDLVGHGEGQEEQGEGRHHPDQGRGLAQAGHHQEVDQDAERGGDGDGDEPGQGRRPPVIGGAPVVQERADHGERALGEVDDARAAVDEDEALGRQRVDRADAQPEEDEPEELGQRVTPTRSRSRPGTRRPRTARFRRPTPPAPGT